MPKIKASLTVSPRARPCFWQQILKSETSLVTHFLSDLLHKANYCPQCSYMLINQHRSSQFISITTNAMHQERHKLEGQMR